MADGGWDEDAHPRGPDGKFGGGGVKVHDAKHDAHGGRIMPDGHIQLSEHSKKDKAIAAANAHPDAVSILRYTTGSNRDRFAVLGKDKFAPPSPKDRSEVVQWAAARAGGAARDKSKGARGELQTWAKEKAVKRSDAAAAKKEKDEAPKREWTSTQMAGKEDQTWKDHFSGNPESHKQGEDGLFHEAQLKDPKRGGVPSAERAAMHEEKFLTPAFKDKKPAAELNQKPIAILTMGGPASGKGTVLNMLRAQGLDHKNFVHVDPDEVKGKLPEYKASVPNHKKGTDGEHGNGTGRTFIGAAAQSHEESSYVAKQMEARAIEKGHHVIIDGTGGNAASMVARIKGLEAKGYNVAVHHAHLDKEEGVKRAMGRAEGSGRHVPEPVIRGTYDKITAAMDKIHAAAPNLTVHDGENNHREAYVKKDGKEPAHGMSPMQAIAKGREPKFKIRNK